MDSDRRRLTDFAVPSAGASAASRGPRAPAGHWTVGTRLAVPGGMRLDLLALGSLLPVVSLACGCPAGNRVLPERTVYAELLLQADGESLSGHLLSSPSGDGIAYDRATIPASGVAGPASANDLVLLAMAPGCHPDATGATICDRTIRARLTVHGVAAGAASYVLDDENALLEVQVVPASTALSPCPDKPGLSGSCNVNPAADPPFVTATGLSGSLTLAGLSQDCTNVLQECALSADGLFALAATTPTGRVELTSGTVTARDTLQYRAANTCD